MRELKFRAWIKRENCYMGKWCETQYPVIFSAVNDIADCYSDDEVIVEQYTGLKDKNGIEIYEGDIVMLLKYTYEINGIFECLKSDIRWDNENACFTLGVTMKDGKILLSNTSSYLIIGNIHETRNKE